jgi:hypothetical protein
MVMGTKFLERIAQHDCQICKFSLLAVAAGVILAGGATWTTSTIRARVGTSAEVRIDPSQMMMNAKDLPNEHYVDYSLEFPGHN